jgi:hypothetical protein
MRLRHQPPGEPESPLERLRARAEARKRGDKPMPPLEEVREGWQARSYREHVAYNEALVAWRAGQGPEPVYEHYYMRLDDEDEDPYAAALYAWANGDGPHPDELEHAQDSN